ncbi:MAG TPA: efflux RND transporter periplasmic adaptor subunit [Acidobacteriaceae bacterium]|jgi:RND family efflux transporter MFP subunit
MQSTKVEQSRKIEATGSRARRIVSSVAGALLIAGLVLAGTLPRIERHREALAAVRGAPATHPVVSVIRPQTGQPQSVLLLPGNIQPLYTADVYARTDGYVERRNVDIGSKVRTGEVLAVISSPELDQQLLQARATVTQAEAALQQAQAGLEQAKANAELARITQERDIPLGEQKAIAQQIVDEAVQAFHARTADVTAAEANIAVASANLKANRANVERLAQMQGFERVLAPFDGVITARNVERGDLVNSGNGGTKPLFSIAQSGVLRIQVNVPQSQAVNITPGERASLDVSERPGREYVGTVARVASSLDDAARTMLTEVQVDNRDGSLLPGMYAQVRFVLTRRQPAFVIPSSALIIDRSGMRVASVSSDDRIHFIPVEIGHDMGKQIEIVHGLRGDEALVTNPSDLLSEGQAIKEQ